MADFNTFHIPASSIGPVDPVSGHGAKGKPAEAAPGFQDILKEQLSGISREADKVANAANPSIEDVNSVMNAAKNVFDDTMQAHRLMQQMINNLPEDISSESGEGPDLSSR